MSGEVPSSSLDDAGNEDKSDDDDNDADDLASFAGLFIRIAFSSVNPL